MNDLRAYLLAAFAAASSCPEDSTPPPRSAAAQQPAEAAPAPGPGPDPECLDRWLAERKLNPYGDPEGTVYAGGTPLFDEATGRSEDRGAHVVRKHPEAGEACGVPKR